MTANIGDDMVDQQKNRVSTLVFTRNNINGVRSLVEQVATFSDEIVIIDSSDSKYNSCLQSITLVSDKIKVHFAPALGYVEPLRMYGISKCSSEWILNLDADEMLSSDFARDIRSLLQRAAAGCFSILRINKTTNGKIDSKEFIMNRLFRSHCFIYKGYIHEEPGFSGKLERLSPIYNIIHLHEEFSKDILREIPVEAYYNRIAYRDLPTDTRLSNRIRSPILLTFLKVYVRFKGRSIDSELSSVDYMVYAFSFLLPLVNPLNWRFAKSRIGFTRYQVVKFLSFQKVGFEERMQQFRLATKIKESGGVITFLSLDDENVVNKLYKQYLDFAGTPDEFFISLLLDKGAANG